MEESRDEKQVNSNNKRSSKEETCLNIKKMRFLSQDESSRSKSISNVNSSNESLSNDDHQQQSTDYVEVKQDRNSIDILARLFPNQKRNVMELVLQGCNGDALKTIDYFLRLSENLALNGIKTLNHSPTKSSSLNKSNNNQAHQPNKATTKKQFAQQTKSSPDIKRSFVTLQNLPQNLNAKSDQIASKRLNTSSAFSPLTKSNRIKDHLNSSLSSNISAQNLSLSPYNSTSTDDSLNKSAAMMNPLQFSIDPTNSIISPMTNYLTSVSGSLPANLTNYSSLSTNPGNLFCNSSTKAGQPINANLNQHFLLNHSLPKATGLTTGLTNGTLQNAINPLLNSIRVSSNNCSLSCNTPRSDSQQCASSNCTSCSSNHLTNSLLNATAHQPQTNSRDTPSSVQLYAQPFNSSLIDFTFNSSPAALASFLLKNNSANHSTRFYRNSLDVMDLSNNTNYETPLDSQLQLRFKTIQSTSTK